MYLKVDSYEGESYFHEMFVMSVEYIQLAVDCCEYVAIVGSLQVQRQNLTFPKRPPHTKPLEGTYTTTSTPSNTSSINVALQRTHEA